MFLKRTLVLTALLIGLSACMRPIVEPEGEEGIKQETDYKKVANINVQLGLGYLKQNDFPRAKKKLFYALSLAPNNAGAVGAAAFYFEKTQQLDKADSYYQKALKLSNNAGAELNNYGAFLCREKKYSLANAYFLRAAKDSKYLNTASAYENAALCALDNKNFVAAKQYFVEALEHDPRRETAVMALMRLYNEEKSYDKTLALMDRYELVASMQPGPIYLSYLAAKSSGKAQAAKGYAWILKKRFPQTNQYQQLLEGLPENVG